ncbi:hypothetical protein [uncultured Methylobacterium sp.]|uniref:hypothetical protein n=1 Tax=uncultured Methylobacterium sp. TaxID=157278 RepID=UPI0035CC52F4
MRTFTLTLVAAVLSTTAALAQSPSGNVGQPERGVPQAGQTTRGPIDNPSTYGVYRNADRPVLVDPDVTGTVIDGPYRSNSEAIVEDSAKGGNAEQTNRIVPNLGTTSGGPRF